jgi:hypothetical protein
MFDLPEEHLELLPRGQRGEPHPCRRIGTTTAYDLMYEGNIRRSVWELHSSVV